MSLVSTESGSAVLSCPPNSLRRRQGSIAVLPAWKCFGDSFVNFGRLMANYSVDPATDGGFAGTGRPRLPAAGYAGRSATSSQSYALVVKST